MGALFPKLEHPWVDDSEAPLYVMTYPPQNTDQDLIDRHAEIGEWYKTVDKPIAWVVDCTNIAKAPATQRKIVSNHEKMTKPYAERFNAGVGIVITSDWVRGLLTAIFWISPPPYAYKVFATKEQAKIWAKEKLTRAELNCKKTI